MTVKKTVFIGVETMTNVKKDEPVIKTNMNNPKEEYIRVEIELLDFTGEDSIFECSESAYW